MKKKKKKTDEVRSSLEIGLEKAEKMGKGEQNPSDNEREPVVEVSRRELDALREKAAQTDKCREQMLRLAAEFENFKKRIERERADALKYALDNVMYELITVIDNFERALAAFESGTDPDRIREGVGLIYSQLLSLLKKHGVEPIEARGAPFDPERHEAIGHEPSSQPEGTILAEHGKGYMLHDRLLRPSTVTISKGSTQRG